MMLERLKEDLRYLKQQQAKIMGKIDIKAKTDVVQLFTKIATTSTRTIQGTEVADHLGAAFVVDIGAWTANDLTVKFQHRDSTSDAWADIPVGELDFSGQPVSTQDFAIVTGLANKVVKVGYLGNKRYIGAVITDAADGSAVVGVSVVKGFPKDIKW
jgi:hypothetical protein